MESAPNITGVERTSKEIQEFEQKAMNILNSEILGNLITTFNKILSEKSKKFRESGGDLDSTTGQLLNEIRTEINGSKFTKIK
ncbi:MAG TPA: hypothetical protein VGO63_01910 [Candidatus Paceibacterota bacterium]|jgi:hypothetical protein|nr:hypothetical protein [Candidatus Paceibacterota bacterium]